MTKPIPVSLSCPACGGSMRLYGLRCEPCGVEVRGTVEGNEFATLSGDDLHLLRVFVLAEGRIRDMEAPLGFSYPTIRTRLSQLRKKVRQEGMKQTPSARPEEVLDQLNHGSLSFEEALEKIKKRKP